jgi:hypothetical protein
MARLTISQRLAKMDARVSQFTGPRMIRIVNKVLRELRDHIKTRHMGASRTGYKRLARNTGKMEENTIASRAEQTAEGVKGAVKINVRYASIHFGERTSTLILPRKKKALAVPLSPIIGANKRPMFAAGSSQLQGKFTRSGTLYGKLPGESAADPLFRMASSVVVPMRVSIERDIQPVADEMLERTIQDEVNKIFGE